MEYDGYGFVEKRIMYAHTHIYFLLHSIPFAVLTFLLVIIILFFCFLVCFLVLRNN